MSTVKSPLLDYFVHIKSWHILQYTQQHFFPFSACYFLACTQICISQCVYWRAMACDSSAPLSQHNNVYLTHWACRHLCSPLTCPVMEEGRRRGVCACVRYNVCGADCYLKSLSLHIDFRWPGTRDDFCFFPVAASKTFRTSSRSFVGTWTNSLEPTDIGLNSFFTLVVSPSSAGAFLDGLCGRTLCCDSGGERVISSSSQASACSCRGVVHPLGIWHDRECLHLASGGAVISCLWDGWVPVVLWCHRTLDPHWVSEGDGWR